MQTRPYGHADIVARLEELALAAAQGPAEPLPHAWLFTGAAGVGKATTALWWTARLKCPAPDSCDGLCPSCKQLAAGTHPDMSLIEPAEDKKGISIDSVRKAIAEMAVKPASAGPRVAIVNPADRMTREAQSAILKLLEEPPGWAVIILVSSNHSALLQTIRSRCQRMSFGMLSEQDSLAVLAAHGLDKASASERLAMSGGNLGLALSREAQALADLAELRGRVEAADTADNEALALDLAERRKKDVSLDTLLLDWSAQRLREQVRRGKPADTGDAAIEALAVLGRNANPRLALRTLLLGRGRT